MITTLLTSIQKSILQNCPNIQSCKIYPPARCDVVAPAVFLTAASYSVGDDPATSELALRVNVNATVVTDSIIENSELVCQSLVCDIARIAHLNSFGCPVSPAKIERIEQDAFKPEFDAYVSWLVEWSHEFHLGESVWLDPGVPPHILHIGEGAING